MPKFTHIILKGRFVGYIMIYTFQDPWEPDTDTVECNVYTRAAPKLTINLPINR